MDVEEFVSVEGLGFTVCEAHPDGSDDREGVGLREVQLDSTARKNALANVGDRVIIDPVREPVEATNVVFTTCDEYRNHEDSCQAAETACGDSHEDDQAEWDGLTDEDEFISSVHAELDGTPISVYDDIEIPNGDESRTINVRNTAPDDVVTITGETELVHRNCLEPSAYDRLLDESRLVLDQVVEGIRMRKTRARRLIYAMLFVIGGYFVIGRSLFETTIPSVLQPGSPSAFRMAMEAFWTQSRVAISVSLLATSVAILLAIWSYKLRATHYIGPSPRALEQFFDDHCSTFEIKNRLLDGYRYWIQKSAKTDDRQNTLVRLSLVSALFGVVYFFLALWRVAFGDGFSNLHWTAVLVGVPIAAFVLDKLALRVLERTV